MKGCYVCFLDKNAEAFFRSRTERARIERTRRPSIGTAFGCSVADVMSEQLQRFQQPALQRLKTIECVIVAAILAGDLARPPGYMASERASLFVSYARSDFERVSPVVDAIRSELKSHALPVDLWMDISNLHPGEQWNLAIAEALKVSVGLLLFLSSRSLASGWVRQEVELAAQSAERLIIPVLLDRNLDLPSSISSRQWVDLSGSRTKDEIDKAATRIADAAASYLRTVRLPRAAVSNVEAPLIANEIASQVRASAEPPPKQTTQNSVFVVHGHNMQALTELETYLSSLGILPIVLSRQDSSPQSLFQKFMSVAAQARFAIVLLGADDYGASRKQYDAKGVADRALQFRARQNVILELGFFYGRLGFENVFVVYREPDQVFPNFERPSDLEGVVFQSYSDADWEKKLASKLAEAGFELTSVNIQDSQA